MQEVSAEEAKSLVEQLRQKRKALGLSRVATASRLGVSFHTIESWERNRFLPRPKQARKIAKFLADAASK